MAKAAMLTEGERLFEEFCTRHGVTYERVPEGTDPTPDYRVWYDGCSCWFEIKQIDIDEDFRAPVMSRTPGAHIRAKIDAARGQVRAAAELSEPAVLLILNNLDPLQMFGTEQTDFLAAMHGDLQMVLDNDLEYVEMRRGRNRQFRPGKNQNFSGIGLLRRSPDGPAILIFENPHSRHPIQRLPVPFAIDRAI